MLKRNQLKRKMLQRKSKRNQLKRRLNIMKKKKMMMNGLLFLLLERTQREDDTYETSFKKDRSHLLI